MGIEARGWKDLELMKRVKSSNMIYFAEWVKECDRMIAFQRKVET